MRIAVCFSGQMRTAVCASKSIIDFFGDRFDDIDIFIHTWDINTVAPKYFDGRPGEDGSDTKKVPQNDFDKLSEIYNPKVFEVEQWSTWGDKRTNEICGRNDGKVGPLNPLFYSAHESNHYRVEYEKEHGITYEWVFKMRLDVLFKDNHTISDEIDWMIHRGDFFYVNDAFNKLPEFVEDIMWASRPEIMNTAVKVNTAMENDVSSTNVDWQVYFKIYLNSHNIPIKGFYYNELLLCRDTTDDPILDVDEMLNDYNKRNKKRLI